VGNEVHDLVLHLELIQKLADAAYAWAARLASHHSLLCLPHFHQVGLMRATRSKQLSALLTAAAIEPLISKAIPITRNAAKRNDIMWIN
jgi:hypothetical protein